ncbi:molybdopterin molybdotransferase MoeA [Sediminibacterium sp.]|uniref:molybdopterin molybdotransferase MoeA n=1 Tax=Sediminibacterium sp. TaxID=1917865 RepID=UPI003F695E5D
MITVSEAKQALFSKVRTLDPIIHPLAESAGRVVAEDIKSPIDMPGFLQSSMDGYAVSSFATDQLLQLQDELPAGSNRSLTLQEGKAIKVFTGGPVPSGATWVVQKEWVEEKAEGIIIRQTKQEIGLNIRMPGSSVKKDAVVLTKGTCLHAYQIAMLASLGITGLSVFPAPKIALIITGNELVKPGDVLEYGQVYESNSMGLTAALKQLGVNQCRLQWVKDDLADTKAAIDQALQWADLILLTGGISVGDYDFVAAAAQQAGVDTIFHGVKQKPGKPLFAGQLNQTLIMGLPGNPSSVLHCFQQYVKPVIQLMMGMQISPAQQARMAQGYEKNTPFDFFVKGFLQNGEVTILEAQASYQVGAFSVANCWVELPAAEFRFSKGQQVTVYLF